MPEIEPPRRKSPPRRAPESSVPWGWILFAVFSFVGACGFVFCLLAIGAAVVSRNMAQANRPNAPPGPDLLQIDGPRDIMRAELEEKTVAQPKADAKNPRFAFLDFSNVANTGRLEGIVYADNHFHELPLGVQTMAEVPFKVEDRYMLFREQTRAFGPIGVGSKFTKLHVCHGSHFYGGDGEVLANFVLNYADGDLEPISVRYRRDVVNYWTAHGVPTHAKIAWRGENRAARSQGCGLALFMSTYENPHPEKSVKSIDYVRMNAGQVAHFCIALTIEKK